MNLKPFSKSFLTAGRILTYRQRPWPVASVKLSAKSSYSENPTRCNSLSKFVSFFILNEAQHVLGDTPPIIRRLKLHKQPLIFHMWKVVGRAVVGRCQGAYATWQRPTTARPTTFHSMQNHATWQRPTTARPTTFHVCKPEDCLCSFRLLMMGRVSPDTCWA
jgi:hypothetical protein